MPTKSLVPLFLTLSLLSSCVNVPKTIGQGNKTTEKKQIVDQSQNFEEIKSLIINNAPSPWTSVIDKLSALAIGLVLIIQLTKAKTRGLRKLK